MTGKQLAAVVNDPLDDEDAKKQRIHGTESLIVLDDLERDLQRLEAAIAKVREPAAHLRKELEVIQRSGRKYETSMDAAVKEMYHAATDLAHDARVPVDAVQDLLSHLPDGRRDLRKEVWRRF